MTKSNPFNQFSQIYCISLERSTERREYIKKEFDRVGLDKYEFIDAYDKNSKEVSVLYNSDFVKKHPPCFRCGCDKCDCDNKSLFRPQIGNWLSHIKAWKCIANDNLRLALICEDDVKFQDTIHKSLEVIAESDKILHTLETIQPILIRLGWALCEEHNEHCAPQLTEQIRMANPCYAINAPMASLLMDSLEEINTTSDIYLHKTIGPTIAHFTMIPPAAYELSWSTGELISEIRPKNKRVNFLREQLETLKHQDPEYQTTKASYEKEAIRLEQFCQFNESPITDYQDKYDLI